MDGVEHLLTGQEAGLQWHTVTAAAVRDERSDGEEFGRVDATGIGVQIGRRQSHTDHDRRLHRCSECDIFLGLADHMKLERRSLGGLIVVLRIRSLPPMAGFLFGRALGRVSFGSVLALLRAVTLSPAAALALFTAGASVDDPWPVVVAKVGTVCHCRCVALGSQIVAHVAVGDVRLGFTRNGSVRRLAFTNPGTVGVWGSWMTTDSFLMDRSWLRGLLEEMEWSTPNGGYTKFVRKEFFGQT